MRSWIALVVLAVAGLLPAQQPQQRKPHVVFLVGEREYGSERTMPAFASRLEDELSLRTTVLQSRRNELPDLAALGDADLLVLFLRFREATDAQFARLRRWFDDGRPCVALRTTSHAFRNDKGWFPPLFGGHYKAHAPNGQGTVAWVDPRQDLHPLVRGIARSFEMGHGGTYNAQPLADAATPILFGRTGALPCEPVAWIHRYRPESRIFYTSLGSRENFERDDFQRLLGNAVLWALGREVPASGAFAGGRAREPFVPAAPPAPPELAAPERATVLFGDGDTSAWRHWDPSVEPQAIGIDRRADTSAGGPTYEGARWQVDGRALVARPGFGDLVTRASFGNYHLHADVYVPAAPQGTPATFGGRSGVFLAGRYEIEIAGATGDRFGNGAIYGQLAAAAPAAAGHWHALDVHFSQVQDRDPVIRASWNGERIHDRVTVRERTTYGFRAAAAGARSAVAGGGVRYARKPDNSFRFGDGVFTIAARFKSTANGTIASKSPATGPWQPDAKALFLRGGRLVYDIGWVGQMQTRERYDDGKWHRVLLTHDDEGTALLFVDGERVARKEDFVKEDDEGHVFKVGAASPDFGMPFRGEISDVTVFEHNVPQDKAAQWTRGEVIDMGAPSLRWEPPKQPVDERPEVAAKVVEAPIRLQADCAAVRFANVWVEPLDDVVGIDAPRSALDDSRWPDYRKMDYGDALHWTYQVGDDRNIVQKGLAVRLDGGEGGVSRGYAFMVYDLDTLAMAAAWSGTGFIDWKGVAFDGSHNSHASIVGDIEVRNELGPGWARPGTGDFSDQRLVGRDGRRFGPIAREWGRFLGSRKVGGRTMLEYEVGGARVRELPSALEHNGRFVFVRTLSVAPSRHELRMRIGPKGSPHAVSGPAAKPGAVEHVLLRSRTGTRRAEVDVVDGHHVLILGPGDEEVGLQVFLGSLHGVGSVTSGIARSLEDELARMSAPPTSRWQQTARSQVRAGGDDGIWVVDEFALPDTDRNPYRSWMRLGAFDFFADGRRAAVSTWNGDVWIVSGIDRKQGPLTWRRFAAGLFQPLGVRIVDETIYVACRDQICVLEDTNGDGEADHYRCFNNDHQVTEHFHEFAMGLQTDADGNFYYAKSARHAKTALVPHHGTLLRVSKDGSRTTIVANGFRAANGVCINGDGSFYVTDQEGHWTPKNRINRVVEGGFYGNMMGYHDRTSTADEDMQQPLCWITNAFDRSPAELVRVRGDRWGLPDNALLEVSYGMGRVFLVLEDEVDGRHQGAMVALPFGPFATGVMRGRFHPGNGQLYCCGLYGWSGARTRPGGFYRVRYTGAPVAVPVAMHAVPGGLELTFGCAVDEELAADPQSFGVRTWQLRRSKSYGSKHVDERALAVAAATRSADGRTVLLKIPDLEATMCLEVKVDLDTAEGAPLRATIHGTIHRMPEAK
ncbi:MAG: DUF6797 domain-containing protein [Planctomycetota bacterium]